MDKDDTRRKAGREGSLLDFDIDIDRIDKEGTSPSSVILGDRYQDMTILVEDSGSSVTTKTRKSTANKSLRDQRRKERRKKMRTQRAQRRILMPKLRSPKISLAGRGTLKLNNKNNNLK